MKQGDESIPGKSSVSDIKTPLEQRLSKRTLNIIRVLVLIGVIILTAFLVINRDRIQHLQVYGYPGIFLVSLLSYATIIVPVPAVVLTSVMGAVFNPFFVSIAAGVGASLGELSGYLAGFSGQMVVEDKPHYDRIVRWMRKYGGLTILVLATIPNPLFDLVGILAGMLKMPIWKFLMFCMIGNIIKMMMFAFAGDWLMNVLGGLI